MNIAIEISNRSYAKRSRVGAIIVKDHSIISDGYNGMPYGFDNECETNDTTNSEVIHAEANAICKMAKHTLSSDNADLYVTMSPCVECAKLIIQSGIKAVYFSTRYRNLDGVNFLKKANIKVFEKNQESNNFCEYIE